MKYIIQNNDQRIFQNRFYDLETKALLSPIETQNYTIIQVAESYYTHDFFIDNHQQFCDLELTFSHINGLLCAAIVIQMLLGAPLVQMAGELIVVMAVSIVMIVSNARHGIWDESARPSVRGNAQTALLAGAAVAAVVAAVNRNVLLGLGAGAVMFALCFMLLGMLMAYMHRRQKKQDEALEDE